MLLSTDNISLLNQSSTVSDLKNRRNFCKNRKVSLSDYQTFSVLEEQFSIYK